MRKKLNEIKLKMEGIAVFQIHALLPQEITSQKILGNG